MPQAETGNLVLDQLLDRVLDRHLKFTEARQPLMSGRALHYEPFGEDVRLSAASAALSPLEPPRGK